MAASKAVTASEDGAGDEDVPIQGPRAGAVCVCGTAPLDPANNGLGEVAPT